MTNPFDAASDPDRHYIWQRLVIADSEAFAASDWAMIENDFDAESFAGIRCGMSANPKDWQITFPTLESYRDSWLAASRELAGTSAETIISRCELQQIQINGNRAIAVKKFPHANRQTLYRLRRINGVWKIVGFLGFLPL